MSGYSEIEDVESVFQRLVQSLDDVEVPRASHYRMYLKVCEFAAQQNLSPREATAETVRALIALVRDAPVAWHGWAETEDRINAEFWLSVADRRKRLLQYELP